jgi:imidazolonepropionase
MGPPRVEAKSGYGLTPDGEIKILKATKQVNQLHCINVLSTCMGAQVPSLEYRSNMDAFVDQTAEELIPKAAEEGLAEFCDVFCEKGSFTLEQAKRVLLRANVTD